MHAGGARVDVECTQVVQDIDRDAADFHQFRFAQLARPCATIVVAAHCRDRRYIRQLGEHVAAADISRMQDMFNAIERAFSRRTQQVMCIGNEADPDWC